MRKLGLLLIALMVTGLISACTNPATSTTTAKTDVSQNLSNTDFYNNVIDEPTNAYFTNDPVSIEDLKLMAMAGVNSPSAMNSQPWHFSIVNSKDKLESIAAVMKEKMKEMMGKMKPPEGMKPGSGPAVNSNEEARKAGKIAPAKADIGSVPACIIISCRKGNEYDAGLATTNISQMAKILGYASKIVSSPKEAIKTKEMKQEFGVPDDMEVVGVVLIGKKDESITPDYDGYTSATVRNDFSQMVSIIE